MGEKEASVPRPSAVEPSGPAPFPTETVSDAHSNEPLSAPQTTADLQAVGTRSLVGHGPTDHTTRRPRPRLGWPRRVFSQVLMVQLAIAAGVTALATGLFLAPLSAQLDDQAMRRALAIAQTTAAEPRLDDALESPVRRATAPYSTRRSGFAPPPAPSTW